MLHLCLVSVLKLMCITTDMQRSSVKLMVDHAIRCVQQVMNSSRDRIREVFKLMRVERRLTRTYFSRIRQGDWCEQKHHTA